MEQSWSAQTCFLSDESENHKTQSKVTPTSLCKCTEHREVSGPHHRLFHSLNPLSLDCITCSGRPSYCASGSPFTCEMGPDCTWGSLSFSGFASSWVLCLLLSKVLTSSLSSLSVWLLNVTAYSSSVSSSLTTLKLLLLRTTQSLTMTHP